MSARWVGDRAAAALNHEPDRTARELLQSLRAAGVDVTKSELNAVLYGDKRFENDGGGTPRWRLSEGAASGSPVPKPRVPIPAAREIDLYAWQREALDAWRNSGHHGVVEAVTGTGKTRVGLAAVADAIGDGARAMVIVPSIELLTQWEGQVRQLLPGARIGRLGGGHQARWSTANVIIAVVNSARAADLGPPGNRSVLVADECHRYGSESNSLALDDRFDRRLGLSATYQRSDDGNDNFLDPYFGDTCFRMGYRRAIDDGVTARFNVALIATRFTGAERAAYDEANLEAWKAQKWLLERKLVREEPFGEFMKDVSALAGGSMRPGRPQARAFLKNFTERRRVLAETAAKREYLTAMAPAFRTADRSILFTQTVDSAEEAAELVRSTGVDAAAVHSAMDDRTRRQTLQRFGAGQLDVISAPQILDEGVDVPAADLAVIVAASRTRRQMIQRMGRVLRLKADGRRARFAILYVAGSSEDPASGAHGDFLDEITEVADRVENFGLDADPAVVCDYLSTLHGEWTGAQSMPPSAVANAAPARSANPPPAGVVSKGMGKRRRKRIFREAGRGSLSGPVRQALNELLDRFADVGDEALITALRQTTDPALFEAIVTGRPAVSTKRTQPDPSPPSSGPQRVESSTGRSRPRALSPRDKAVVAQYGQRHPKWVDRFLPDIEEILRKYPNVPEPVFMAAVQASHDPREIEHRVRIRTAPKKPKSNRPPPGRPKVGAAGRSGSSSPQRKPKPKRKKPSSPPKTPPGPFGRQPPPRLGLSGRARFCPSCGRREEVCACS